MSGELMKADAAYISEDKKVMKEKSKIGHRRINDQGTVTYKKKTSSEIQKALQLGIRISVTIAHEKSKRDMLLRDFGVVETLAFPRSGSKDTPMHDLSDFTFKTFAPIAFRYFRDFFQVDITDYLNSICHQELRELSNAGASGSIFYITCDDEFIIKTVQHKEASFLQKLLPEYYINLIQHPRTLLPKFYGLYCYQTMGKNIRFVIMNNLVPSIKIHEKYDLKGSTYKRIASPGEKSKASPTLKDLDFRENHSEGLYLEVETYEALLNTIHRDCRVLESFSIMDYSFLLGIHNIDQNLREKQVLESDGDNLNRPLSDNHAIKDNFLSDDINERSDKLDVGLNPISINDDINISEASKTSETTTLSLVNKFEPSSSELYCTPKHEESVRAQNNQSNATEANVCSKPTNDNKPAIKTRETFNRQKSRSRSTRRIAAYSTVLESIHAPVEQVESSNSDDDYIPTGGIPARNKMGDRLILFMGVIDILQSYRLLKKMEHNVKAIFLDANTISVTNPTFYAQRFQDFFANVVFRKIPSLDQPQILGPHARRFRNFVHMAMRQNPDRKRSSIRKDISSRENMIITRDANDKLKMVSTESNAKKEANLDSKMPESKTLEQNPVIPVSSP